MDLKLIPLVQAGWLRYLMAVDDAGKAFEPSPDPLLADCQKYVKDFTLGQKVTKEEAKDKLLPLLQNAQIFGVDLEKAGLSDRVAGYFTELIAGTGAVRAALHKYVNE